MATVATRAGKERCTAAAVAQVLLQAAREIVLAFSCLTCIKIFFGKQMTTSLLTEARITVVKY